jgi:hypothetical protein
MQSQTHNFLRRTAAALAAVAGFTLISTLDAQAAAGTVSLSTGASCAYSGIALGPDGGLTVTCSGTTVTPPPAGPTLAGTFTIYGSDTLDGTKNEYLWYSVARSGSSTDGGGAVALTATGGCTLSPSSVTFADKSGDGSYQVFGVVAPKDSTGKIYPTTCVVSITQQTPALSLGNASGKSISVTGPGTVPGSPIGGPTTTPPAGCPAIPSDAINLANSTATNINYGGNSFVYMKSGIIGYTPLPAPLSSYMAFPGQYGSAKVQIMQTSASPRDGSYEISIGRCPGVIDSSGSGSSAGNTGGTCYRSSPTMPAIVSLSWFEAPGSSTAGTDAQANAWAMCEAYASKGPWYVNVRYNYTSCAYGTCDYVLNWNWDSVMP